MHEISILLSMADEIKSLPEITAGNKVKRIILKIGEVSGVDVDALHFAFPLLQEQDPFWDSAELQIEKVLLCIECNNCGATSTARKRDVKCGTCGSRDIAFIGGDEILISDIEIESLS